MNSAHIFGKLPRHGGDRDDSFEVYGASSSQNVNGAVNYKLRWISWDSRISFAQT